MRSVYPLTVISQSQYIVFIFLVRTPIYIGSISLISSSHLKNNVLLPTPPIVHLSEITIIIIQSYHYITYHFNTRRVSTTAINITLFNTGFIQ